MSQGQPGFIGLRIGFVPAWQEGGAESVSESEAAIGADLTVIGAAIGGSPRFRE
jgi:hypothetical protein